MDKKNMSAKVDVNENIILQNYMLERLLERISVSNYKYKFVLKGGMLITAIVGIDMRNTLDMDATIKVFTEKLSKYNVNEIIIDGIFAALASYVIEAIEQGKTLVIDELDSSLHFKITRAIISMFNNEINKKAQSAFFICQIIRRFVEYIYKLCKQDYNIIKTNLLYV